MSSDQPSSESCPANKHGTSEYQSLWGTDLHPKQRIRPTSAIVHGIKRLAATPQVPPCLPRKDINKRRPNTARAALLHPPVVNVENNNKKAPATTRSMPHDIKRPISACLARSQRRRDTCSAIETQRNKQAAAVYGSQLRMVHNRD